MKRIQLLVCFFVILGVAFVNAQEKYSAAFDFVIGAPQGEFKDNVDKVGIGLSGNFLFKIPNSPLGLGANFGYMAYGRETREEPLINELIMVDIITTNAIVNFGLLGRLQSPVGGLRPYFEGEAGFNYLFTESEIRDQDDWEGDEIASSTNFDDFAFYYGIGAGLWIQVFSGEAENGNPYSIFVDLGVKYIAGNEAEYLKPGSIEVDEAGKIHFDEIRSTTDMLRFKVGVGFSF